MWLILVVDICRKSGELVVTITVKESPIINKVEFQGIKSKTLVESLSKNLSLKSRSSYNTYQLAYIAYTDDKVFCYHEF